MNVVKDEAAAIEIERGETVIDDGETVDLADQLAYEIKDSLDELDFTITD